MQAARLTFTADHPATPGHFPGNPIIPGALLLSRVIEVIAQKHAPCEIRMVKFLHPVRPGQDIALEWSKSPSGAISFSCNLDDGTPVMSGSANLAGRSC